MTGARTPGDAPPEADFLYFAFGSNLDAARLHLHCPSARLVTIARLDDHRLEFTLESRTTWRGGVADVRAAPGEHVWGALWLIAGHESRALDTQEGVFREPPAYRRYRVTVETPAGDVVSCRCYQVVSPDPEGFAPSPAYRDTLLRGARTLDLPADYLARLESIRDNGVGGGGPG